MSRCITNPSFPLVKILVPTDFSKASRYALRMATTLARGFHSSIILLNVVKSIEAAIDVGYGTFIRSRPDQKEIRRASRRLNVIAEHLEVDGQRPSCLVQTGNPEFEILEVARKYKTSLVIMGAHPKAPGQLASPRGLAERLVRSAPCSVIVVRVPNSMHALQKEHLSVQLHPAYSTGAS